MAKKMYDETRIAAIAEKIREHTKTETKYSTAEMPNGVDEVYLAGFEAGKEQGGGEAENPLYLATELWYTYSNAVFPENYSLTLNLKNAPTKCYQVFKNTTNLKTVKFIFESKDDPITLDQTFRESGVEVVDFTETSCKFYGNINYAFFQANNLLSILGKLDLSACTNFNYSFHCGKLKDIEIVPNSIYYTIRFNSYYLTEKSRQSIIDGLADLTGSEPQTLTLNGVASLLTDAQKAQISAKNWTLAY